MAAVAHGLSVTGDIIWISSVHWCAEIKGARLSNRILPCPSM